MSRTSWWRGVVAIAALLGLLGATGVSAKTLMMPNREALQGVQIVVWGNTNLASFRAPDPNDPNDPGVAGSSFMIDFGDGSSVSGVVGDPTSVPAGVSADARYLAAEHVYSSPTGVKSATLKVCTPAPCDPTAGGESATALVTVSNPAAGSNEERATQVSNAIEDGLRWLYTHQDCGVLGPDLSAPPPGGGGSEDGAVPTLGTCPPETTTSWAGDRAKEQTDESYRTAYTSLAVLAFQNHGHKVTGSDSDIYKDVVQRGLNFLFDQLAILDLNVEPAGDPCVGVPADADKCKGLKDQGGTNGYGTSVASLAIAGSGAPTRLVGADLALGQSLGTNNGDFVMGRTYLEVLQRVVNTVAWGAVDPGNSCDAADFHRGGYRYTLDGCDSDGSAIGWAVLAYFDGAAFGATVPTFAAPELRFVIDHTTTNPDGGLEYDRFCCDGTGSNVLRTGVLLQALAFMGESLASDPRVGKARDYISANWNEESGDDFRCANGKYNKGCLYAMFQVFKGLKLHGISSLAGVPRVDKDWHEDYITFLLGNQHNNTSVLGNGDWGIPESDWSCCDSPSFSSGPASTTVGVTALAELILSSSALVAPDTILLTPASGTNPVGLTHTVTALATNGGNPVAGTSITFLVISGPNTGVTGSSVTGPDGKATFQYASSVTGTDTIRANAGAVLSNTVTKTWVSGPPHITVGNLNPTKLGTTMTVPVRLTSDGGDNAKNVRITSVVVNSPSCATHTTALPVLYGDINIGANVTHDLTFTLGAGVACGTGQIVRFTVNGTFKNTAGTTTFAFSSARSVKIPAPPAP